MKRPTAPAPSAPSRPSPQTPSNPRSGPSAEPTGPTPAQLAAQRKRQEQLAAQRRREEAAAREKARREAILAAGARDRARLLAARRERERLAREAAANANTTSTGAGAAVPRTSGNPGVGTVALILGLIAACGAALFGGRLFARRQGRAPAPYRALAQRVPDGVKRVIAIAEGELLLAGAAVGATLLVIVIWVVTI